MEEPYRYEKKVVKIGNSNYVGIPVGWLGKNVKKVIVEVYKDMLRVLPCKQKMQVKNNLDKDLTIAFGSNPDDTVLGTLKAGAVRELPIENYRFFNIFAIAKQKMDEKLDETLTEILTKLAKLEKVMNDRFERMKKIVADYLTLGNEFACNTLRTSLKSV